MHPLLHRQLRREFGDAPPDGDAWRRLLALVDRGYCEADEDRALLERSLELTSEELIEKNRRQREAAEAALHLTQASIDRSAVPMFRLDSEGRFLYVNEAATRSLGYARAELTALAMHDIAPGGTRDAWSARWQELRARGSLVFEGTHRRRDGTTFPVEVTLNHLEFQGREYAVGMAMDIGRRRQLEAKLRKAAKMEAVGQLAGGIAHDFNNQLCGVLGFADLAQRALPPDHPAREHLRFVQEAGERSATIARQLLAFSRRQMLEPKVVDPHDVVAGIQPMLARVLRDDIAVALVRRGPPTHAQVDPGQLEQVIVNLAINARDAMPRGGQLTIEVDGADLDAAGAAARPGARAGRWARLTVRDTGHGMDTGTLARVFEPFFTTKPEGQGTGLGLAMVHGFVYQSEGFIELESAPGAGTTFRLWFPAVAAARPPAVARRPSDSALPRGSAAVLVAEDDAMVRDLAVRVLRACGYAVTEAADGPSALAALREGARPDLLVSDVVMPGLSGLELAEQARALHPALRVCLMSGYPRDDLRRRGVLRPSDRFLGKPITPRALAEAASEALR